MATDIEIPDDATRPEAPVLENLTPEERGPGEHLAMVHDHHRQNMTLLRTLIDEVASGSVSSTGLADATDNLPLLQNYRRFGTLCGQHCQMVHGHHSVEDSYVFPELSAKAEAFRRVINRLMQEHEVVHALLLQLIDALNALLEDPGAENFAQAIAIYEALEKLLLSHFSYEERSIGGALGRFRIGV